MFYEPFCRHYSLISSGRLYHEDSPKYEDGRGERAAGCERAVAVLPGGGVLAGQYILEFGA